MRAGTLRTAVLGSGAYFRAKPHLVSKYAETLHSFFVYPRPFDSCFQNEAVILRLTPYSIKQLELKAKVQVGQRLIAKLT